MNAHVEEKLQSLCLKIMPHEREKLSLRLRMNKLKKLFVSVSNEVLLTCITKFEEKEMYNKGFAYFERMVIGSQEDKLEAREKEKKRLGYMPRNIT